MRFEAESCGTIAVAPPAAAPSFVAEDCTGVEAHISHLPWFASVTVLQALHLQQMHAVIQGDNSCKNRCIPMETHT
jgi:hypothetical protein